jgi:hypothetical protein
MHAVIYALIGVFIILVLGPVSSPKYPPVSCLVPSESPLVSQQCSLFLWLVNLDER